MASARDHHRAGTRKTESASTSAPATKQTPGKYVSWVLGLWLAWEGNWQASGWSKPLCLKMRELLNVLRPVGISHHPRAS